jgi:hypothetical protein
LKIATEAPAARVARRSFRKTGGNLRHKSPAVPSEPASQIATLPNLIPNERFHASKGRRYTSRILHAESARLGVELPDPFTLRR